VICVALSYRRVEPPREHTGPEGPPTGRIAQYARGRDYHVVMRAMLEELVSRLRARLGEPFQARVFVDTGPLLERGLAWAAGLGWIGKNTCLLHQKLGSYLFLGEVITTLELVPDQASADRCGGCTRCLDACPTGALLGPYRLDASRCISYLTIEHRSEVPDELHTAMSDWVFGCDICQEVCPYNAKAPAGRQPEIMVEQIPARLGLLDLLSLRSGEYRRLTKESATRRASRRMWRRNAAIALGNVAKLDLTAREALAQAADSAEPEVRHAAKLALARAR
jgi:epoxyqueuosine reductase